MSEFTLYGWLHSEENPIFNESPNDLSEIKTIFICISTERERTVRNVLNTYTNGGRIMLNLPLTRRSGDLIAKVSVSGNGKGTIYRALTKNMLERMKKCRENQYSDNSAFIGLELAFTVKIRKYQYANPNGDIIAGLRFVLESIDTILP